MERRTFLVLCAAALGLAGCTRQDVAPLPTPPPPDDPDRAIRTRVALSEATLVSAYRRALADHRELAEHLAPFLAHHEAHLARVAPSLDAEALVGEAASSTPSPSGADQGAADPSGTGPSGADQSGTAPSGAGPRGTPSTAEGAEVDAPEVGASAVLALLAQAEAQASRERVSSCDGAADAGLARDLCLIAASEAQHAATLEAITRAAGTTGTAAGAR